VALLYHAVAPPPPGADREERGMFVEPDVLATQMRLLARSGHRSLRLDEVAAMVQAPGTAGAGAAAGRRVLLTFDDAYAHVGDVVTPILLEHGFTAVMFAPWAHLGRRNTWDEGRSRGLSKLQIMTPAELRALERGPWEVASHSARHLDLRRCDPRVRLRELVESREGLSELLGREVLDLAYPFGSHDAAVRSAAADAGYRLAFAANGDAQGGRLALPRRGVSGADSTLMLRLKLSGRAVWLYRAKGVVRRFRREPLNPTDLRV
jgi:peptidoglycan/xylan/chitin deacetylase (PgdA/CDA1 family)